MNIQKVSTVRPLSELKSWDAPRSGFKMPSSDAAKLKTQFRDNSETSAQGILPIALEILQGFT